MQHFKHTCWRWVLFSKANSWLFFKSLLICSSVHCKARPTLYTWRFQFITLTAAAGTYFQTRLLTREVNFEKVIYESTVMKAICIRNKTISFKQQKHNHRQTCINKTHVESNTRLRQSITTWATLKTTFAMPYIGQRAFVNIAAGPRIPVHLRGRPRYDPSHWFAFRTDRWEDLGRNKVNWVWTIAGHLHRIDLHRREQSVYPLFEVRRDFNWIRLALQQEMLVL